MPLVLAMIHSIFGIKFILSMLEVLASPDELLPSIIVTAVVIGAIYGVYFLATYLGSKQIIKEDGLEMESFKEKLPIVNCSNNCNYTTNQHILFFSHT